MQKQEKELRNIAIIAHVDHGKTTLIDAMLKQSGLFRQNEQTLEQMMDTNELERERGITILAKNTAVQYGSVRINVVDTPGHADFGGEVERILNMVDGVLLVVDAYDGPMPQTRFVLGKALTMKKQPLVLINKIDRPDARPAEVLDEIIDLFIDLGADENQLDFPTLYTSAKLGFASRDPAEFKSFQTATSGMRPLLDAICRYVPAPGGSADLALQLLVSNLEYDQFIGQLAIGRIEEGTIAQDQQVVITDATGKDRRTARVAKLYRFAGLARAEITSASAGEIVCVSGLSRINIGETICSPDEVRPLSFTKIDEPTLAMTFQVNDSPFAGNEGQYVTSRHLRDRLLREARRNVSMQIESTDSTDAFIVKGRGELHLSILIETMRREGYEFQVAKPQVITKEVDGSLVEPVEKVVIDVPDEYVGAVMERMGARKAELVSLSPPEHGMVRLAFLIPSRGLIGYRSQFLTETKGNGIINSVVSGYEPWKGPIAMRNHGVLVAWETGEAVVYGLHKAQERGQLLIGPGTAVYEGMIIGSSPKSEDITVNVCKRKHITNIRAAGSDDALRLTPPLQLSLEQCLEFIAGDELVEVTPRSIRLRKRILNTEKRQKQRSQQTDK